LVRANRRILPIFCRGSGLGCGFAEHRPEHVSRLLVHAWQNVRVGVERDRDVRVAETLGHDFAGTPAPSRSVACAPEEAFGREVRARVSARRVRLTDDGRGD